ncbi:MAG: serine/threonine protein kinase [Myxococcales bacterium]|nr:serine/threonine protein kinase [Myxococcales bacterium]
MSATQQNALLLENLSQEGQSASNDEEHRGVHAGRLLDSRFYLEKRLVEDALGLVYGAVDRARHQRVWVRLCPHQVSTDKHVEERLERDLRILASLQHKNILSILHTHREEGFGLFVVSEACLGHNLRALLGSWGSLPREHIAKMWPHYCDALHFAHRKGISHGYLSPSHLWWSSGQPWSDVRLSWFGSPRLMGTQTTNMIAPSSSAYSLKYRSPEQCRSFEQVDHRSDIYTSGLLLFELLTGQHPFEIWRWGQREREWTPMLDWRERHLLMTPPRLSQVAPNISFPEALETLLFSMLQKDPTLRPQSMQEVLDFWQEAIAQWVPTAVHDVPTEIPRELPPEGTRVPRLGNLGLESVSDRVEAWQHVLSLIPTNLRTVMESWLDHSALSGDGGVSLSEPVLQKLQTDGAWVDLLGFHLQRGVPAGLARVLTEQIPEASQASQWMEQMLSMQQRNLQDTGVLRRVSAPRGRSAVTQELSELTTNKKSQSVQAIAAEEILSLSELEARLPGLARMQQSEDGLPAKLSPPKEQTLRAPVASVEAQGAGAVEEDDPEDVRRNWRAALVFLVFLIALVGLIAWYLRGKTPLPADSTKFGAAGEPREVLPSEKKTKPRKDETKPPSFKKDTPVETPKETKKEDVTPESPPPAKRKRVKKRKKTRRRRVSKKRRRKSKKRKRSRSRRKRLRRRKNKKRRGGS